MVFRIRVASPTARLIAAAALCLVWLASPDASAAQDPLVDTLSAPPATPDFQPQARQHSPRGALYRAAAIPGWGQVYNRQYYKLPFVYAGLAGVSYTAWHNHNRYRLYQEAYLFAEPRLWDDSVPRYPEFEAAYRDMLAHQGLAPDDSLPPDEAAARRQRLAPNLRQIRDNFRRNRDLLYAGVGLFYALTILDAYVSAHLFDFDVGEDLTIGVMPAPAGVHARLQVTF